MPRNFGPALLLILIAACGTEPEDGTLMVSIRVSGIDVNTAHTVTVDDEVSPKAIPADGSLELVVPAGDHVVRLHGVAGNCVSSLPTVQPVTIEGGGTTHLDYSITCTPITGYVRLTVTTTGQDLDPDGYTAYTAQPDYFFYNGTAVATNGQVLMGPIGIGAHNLLLEGLAANCKVVGNNPLAITVPKGQLARETVSISMAITCAAKNP